MPSAMTFLPLSEPIRFNKGNDVYLKIFIQNNSYEPIKSKEGHKALSSVIQQSGKILKIQYEV